MAKRTIKMMGVSISVLGILLLVQTMGLADEVRIVRLMKHPYQAAAVDNELEYVIQPENLLIEKGTVVVFANWGAFEAEVKFDDVKSCQIAFDAAEGFKLDKEKECFLARIVPNGGTKSIKFTEKGTYKYKVHWYKRPQPSTGKIIVY